MNLLPFVTIMIIILSIFSFGLIKEHLIINLEHQIHLGFFRAEREARNEVEKSYYDSIKKKPNEGKKPKEPLSYKDPNKSEPKPFPNPRLATHLPENSKLNIHSLFTDEDSSTSIVFEISAELIKRLYSHTPFYPDAKNLVHAIMVKGRKSEQTKLSFVDLIPDDPKMAFAFKKMVNGTRQFNLEKGEGYPPLERFMTINSDEKRMPIIGSSASKAVCQAAFGDKTTDRILMLEQQRHDQKKHPTLLYGEKLERLLQESHAHDISMLLNIIDLKHSSSKSSIAVGIDEVTQIEVTKETKS